MGSENEFEIARLESEKRALTMFRKIFDPKNAKRPELSFFGQNAVRLDTRYGNNGEKQEQKKIFTDLSEMAMPAVAATLPPDERLVCYAGAKSFAPTFYSYDASSYGMVTDPETQIRYHEVSVDTESIDPDPNYLAVIVIHDLACSMVSQMEPQALTQPRELADLITIACLYPEKFTQDGPVPAALAESVQAAQNLVSRTGLDSVGTKIRQYCADTLIEQKRGFSELFKDELPGVRMNILRHTYLHLVPDFYEKPQCFISWDALKWQYSE